MNSIRITGGELKGRVISVPSGNDARFTSSRVREAIFNMIGDVTGKDILDLFAGSGSFTIEAMSRGATAATCVENSAQRAALIENNIRALSIDNSSCRVLDMDVKYAIPFLYKKGTLYDIVFMDPPYDKGYLGEVALLLEQNMLHKKDAILIVECSKREAVDLSLFRNWVSVKTKRYGDTVIAILAGE